MAKDSQALKTRLKQQIQDIFAGDPRATYNNKQLAKLLGPSGITNKKYISGLLYHLAKEGVLIEVYKGKFKLSPLFAEQHKAFSPVVTGRVDMKQTGKAYVITDEMLEDIRISPNNTGHALHDDLVKVRLFPRRKDKKQEGEITEIIERAKTNYVGIVELSRNHAFVVADNKSMPVDIFIPQSAINKAKNGDKVLARITEWPMHSKNPYGEIVTVFGRPGDNEVEMHAILAEYGLPATFPDEVEREAAAIPDTISPDEIASRRDFRDVITFTIDPHDAKDFDDALSVRRISDTLFEIGVHIADVTHYVQPATLLEEEAYERATSIYLVDRTIPMLPEKLSNNLCSLRPLEDKLTYSVVFTMNEKARISKTWVGKTVINSNHRFTYEEAQQIIEEEQGRYYDELHLLNTLAKQLGQKRLKMGAIDFDRQEMKFNLDEKGKPTGVYLKEQKDAHKLIEEFMLLANRAVAEKIGKPSGNKEIKTFVYRIHDHPNLDKLTVLSQFVSKFGYKLKTDTRKHISETFNKMLQDSQGKGEENLIETLSLRTMAKAAYSTNNIGHYGLAFDHYTHFTSPIRRYPDMMVHRMLFAYGQGARSADQQTYEMRCKHASEMEIKAQNAERDSIKYKQVEFMADKVGMQFEGLISGVSKWGIYVQIKENKIEGMIKLRDLDDDYYYLDEDNYQVLGHNKKKVYKLGNPITIRIKRADFLKKELDLEPA